MTRLADTIFLSWRKGSGESRLLVGRFDRTENKSVSFRYLPENVLVAIKEGFSPHPSFPDLGITYENVLPIISRRLVSSERSDRIQYLRFWSADAPSYDEFDQIALTQAWLTNDRFEFLADFIVQDGLTFVTDLAGRSYHEIEPDDVELNENLFLEPEPSNSGDPEAVRVVNKNQKLVGYIKRVHCRAFQPVYLKKYRVTLLVKSHEMNGKLKKVFVQASFTE